MRWRGWGLVLGDLAAAGDPWALRRPLRLSNLRHDGSCPSSPVAGPPVTTAHPSAAVAVGDGPVYPVLFRAGPDGRLDQSAVVYWDAPKALGGVAIVRGHRLGAPSDRIGFQNEQQELGLVHVLDPAAAHPSGREGHWWRTTGSAPAPAATGSRSTGSGSVRCWWSSSARRPRPRPSQRARLRSSGRMAELADA